MNWGGEALMRPEAPVLTRRQKRAREVEEKLLPLLTASERQLYWNMIVTWVNHEKTMIEQLKANINLSRESHAASSSPGKPAEPLALSPRAKALQTLGLPADAKPDEIKRAYWNLSKQHHPDAGATDGERQREINRAYEFLRQGVTWNQ